MRKTITKTIIERDMYYDSMFFCNFEVILKKY
jgi:hypothetical protein